MLPYFLSFIALVMIVLGIFLYTKNHRRQSSHNQKRIDYDSDRIRVNGKKAAMVITIDDCYEFIAQDGKITGCKNIKTGKQITYNISKDS